ncbi:iron-containing redox enzyme family protein [Enhygromyxa salina]|nr:iron-containing redox enzyme family protein [Enhygromyxa salina]
MAEVQGVIQKRTDALATMPLFRSLAASSHLDDLRAIAHHGYFYVLGFQDMLRLTHEQIQDPELGSIALSMRQDDLGHDAWFLADTETLGVSRDVAWVFGDVHRPIRDMVYRLMSELLGASDDRVKIVFPLVLEAAGSIFFASMVDLVKRADYDHALRYFARSHQAAEEAHEVFSESGQEVLDRVNFDLPLYDEAIGLVERCFDCFEQFAERLEQHRIQARAGATS